MKMEATQSQQHATFGSRRAAKNPAFEAKLRHMALPLAPLVQLTTGAVHPSFPQSLLVFWLLTDEQLDGLASFYHQRTPCHLTRQYPCPITWPHGLTLEEKRRKIGKFIGLRGCETPVSAIMMMQQPPSEDDIVEQARQARMADDDEVRRKMRWY